MNLARATVQDLIERLEKATDIDYRIEHDIEIWRSDWHKDTKLSIFPYFMRSIDAALKLIPSPRWCWRIDSHDPSAWVYLNIQDAFKGSGATPAISLCIAALKARATIPEAKT